MSSNRNDRIDRRRFFSRFGKTMRLSLLSNDSLTRYYESVRAQVEADSSMVRMGQHYAFAQNAQLREYALAIHRELNTRGVRIPPTVYGDRLCDRRMLHDLAN